MGEVKGQGHIVQPISNQCASFFTSIEQTIPQICPIECLTLKNTSEIFEENVRKIGFLTEYLQNLIKSWPLPEDYNYQVL